MNTLRLPAAAWAVMTLTGARANPYRYRRETGGWLLARAEEPDTIVAATGPGKDGVLAAESVWISRREFDPAVREQGFVLAGEWHSHPDGTRTGASEDDKKAWALERLKAGVIEWPAVIVARGAGGTWTDEARANAFVTTRDGTREIHLSPAFGPSVLEAARAQDWQVSRGPLLDWPSLWQPGQLRETVDLLELDAAMHERVKLNALNERLRRLGIKTPDLMPVTRSPAAVGSSDPGAAAGEIIHGGQTLYRPNIGTVTAVY